MDSQITMPLGADGDGAVRCTVGLERMAKCPWCNDRSRPIVVTQEPGCVWVECETCRSNGPVAANETDAVRAWNSSQQALHIERMWTHGMILEMWRGNCPPPMTKEEALADCARLDWLTNECRAGRVQLLINHVPRGVGYAVRPAIDDAMGKNK